MEKRKILAILVLASGLMVCAAQLCQAEPMGTAFTYQGHLYDANHVANGLYDFQFKLYDANVGAGKVNVPNVDVIDGYFTVELDFGSDVFDCNAVWLEIGVRPGDQNDPNVYTTLAPRQEVTPVPYALQTRGMFVDDNGNVGIGTASPGVKLQVGDTSVGHDVYIAGSTSSQSGLFFYDGAIPGGMRYNFSSDDLSVFTAGNTRVMIDSAGDVGIGTTSPAVKLQVGDTDVGHDVYIAGATNSQSGLFFYDGGIPGGMRYNFSSDDLSVFTAGTARLMINSSGDVGIGTTSPAYDLDVNGDIRAIGSVYYGGTEGNVDGTAYDKPDYVFEEGYDVMSIEQVEEYLKKENHLPWMTSARDEKEENGDVIDMTRMAFETVETAENLQIQLIELNKSVKAKDVEIAQLKDRVSKMEALLSQLIRCQEGGQL